MSTLFYDLSLLSASVTILMLLFSIKKPSTVYGNIAQTEKYWLFSFLMLMHCR